LTEINSAISRGAHSEPRQRLLQRDDLGLGQIERGIGDPQEVRGHRLIATNQIG
jgi:hypothetical protein